MFYRRSAMFQPGSSKQKSELLLGIAQITAVILRPRPFCSHVVFLHNNLIRFVVPSAQNDTGTEFFYFLP